MYIAPKWFASNLIFLRDKKGVSQTDIALQVSKGHTTIGNWEKGRNYPTIEDAIIISQYFDISINDLLLTDLKNAGKDKKIEIKKLEKNVGDNAGNSAGIVTKNTEFVLAFMESENYQESVGSVYDLDNKEAEMLPWLLQSHEKIKELANLHLPELGEGIHVRLQIINDNMHPTIKYGDKVVITYLPEPATAVREGNIYVVLDKDDGLVCKRLYKAGKELYELISDNKLYKPYKRHLNDILAVFKVVELHTRNFHNAIEDTRQETTEQLNQSGLNLAKKAISMVVKPNEI